VRNLQKQLLESKKNAKMFKALWENIKHSYGISPFTGKLNRKVGDNNIDDSFRISVTD